MEGAPTQNTRISQAVFKGLNGEMFSVFSGEEDEVDTPSPDGDTDETINEIK